jgi:hypothetical protein
MHASWPRDKLVAVALLIAAMTPDSKVAIAAIKREDLLPDHIGMTDFMRLQFGPWDGNTALIKSCACDSPDSAAMLLIEMTWAALSAVHARGD